MDLHIVVKAAGGLPLIAQILVSDVCNHTCQHCYQVHGRKGEMSLTDIEAVLDELARLGVLIVSFSGGEATLRSDLAQILDAARKRSFAIILQTNGYAISDELIEQLVQLGIWRVRISVYSDVGFEHDAVTGVEGSFVRTTESIHRLASRAIAVTMVVPLTRYCSASVQRLEKLATSLGCELEIASSLTAKEDGSLDSLNVEPTSAQLEAYFQTEKARGCSVPERIEKLVESPCSACSQSITIHSNGSVRPCTHIPMEFGRAVNDRGAPALAALVDNDAFRFLAEITWQHLHGCRDCSLLPWCHRCHGSASYETHDLLGPQPSACARAILRYEAHVAPLQQLAAVDPEASTRSPTVGPFEITDTHVLRPIRDVITEADDVLRQKFTWVQPTKALLAQMTGLVPTHRLLKRHRDETPALRYACHEG